VLRLTEPRSKMRIAAPPGKRVAMVRPVDYTMLIIRTARDRAKQP
jgi:hypothetical protein